MLEVVGEIIERGQREGGRLAGAGLRDAAQVAAFQQRRDRLHLDRRRHVIALGGKRALERLGEAEVGEFGHERLSQICAGAAPARGRHERVRSDDPREWGSPGLVRVRGVEPARHVEATGDHAAQVRMIARRRHRRWRPYGAMRRKRQAAVSASACASRIILLDMPPPARHMRSMLIETETTPNPATLKFLPGQIVMATGTRDFADPGGGRGLAARRARCSASAT